MQTLNFSIDIPQGSTIDVAMVKRRILDYAKRLVSIDNNKNAIEQDVELDDAIAFISALEIPGGKNIPVEEDGMMSLLH